MMWSHVTKKYPQIFQEEENDEDFNEHYDIESEKNKIVEYSPKGRFVRVRKFGLRR